jgi:crotonobetaine/carnitine-CoA ligase
MSRFDYLSGSGARIDDWLRWRGQSEGNRLFADFEGTPVSWGEFDDKVEEVARGLAAAGVKRGDPVVVYMHNSLDFLYAMFGIMRLGAVYVPCSTLYPPDELLYQVDHVRARTVFTDPRLLPTLEQVRADCRALETVVVTSAESLPGTVRFDDLLASGQAFVRPAGDAGARAMIMYTSGTTARPKGIIWSHGNVVTIAQNCVYNFRWTPEDRLLHFFAMFHANGGLVCLMPAIMTGAALIMIPKFSATQFAQQLVEHDITYTNMNSTNIKMVLNTEPSDYERRHHTRRMMLGLTLEAAPWLEWERRFNTKLIPTYGLTEALGICIGQTPYDPSRPGSSGRVLRGYQVKVVDQSGAEQPTGVAGEVLVHSVQRHGVTQGYHRDLKRTREVFRGGWVHSGDQGYFDEDGYFWFTGRSKDMIKRSGYNVAPAEIERVIALVPGVKECAVVSTPDAVREEAIVAYIVPAAPGAVSEAAVFAACQASLAEYKVPQFVKLVPEFPLNFLGKLERKVLRQWALEFEVKSRERTRLGGPVGAGS